jgi:hypothetical protein
MHIFSLPQQQKINDHHSLMSRHLSQNAETLFPESNDPARPAAAGQQRVLGWRAMVGGVAS